ncbi:mucin-2 [Pseudoliparis swirei]|uniref:mucin-2 n=1 Tax=Pseudoliparis swirei TaxID=2059687 RepID=UPI0024BDD961|nr:mucin-2 [Pseudoliparis swirei]
MAVAYGALAQPGLLFQHYPPPLLPKPGKDNVRLRKLLKRTAKKKASAQVLQPAALFRSSLSPVNEASPDFELSDRSTPPKTPEAPLGLHGVRQPLRFSVRLLYQHVASPYPQRVRFSPQTVVIPECSYSQHVTAVTSYSEPTHLPGNAPAPGPVAELAVPKISVPVSIVHEATAPAAAGETPKTKGPGPTSYPATGGRAVIHHLVVLTAHGKSKSPRPTFRAKERSRSPRPMFDVPQIRMYTASTSFYESSRTPPVYDTAGLTAIGSTALQEIKLDWASGFGRGMTPTDQLPLMDTEAQRKTPTSGINTIITTTIEVRRVTPTVEIKRAITPTVEIKRAITPTVEIKRAINPTAEIKRATPTIEIKGATPTIEIKRATPTAEIKSATPTIEIKRATPTAEIRRVKTPTFEFQTLRALAGRPRTPAYQLSRATTPVFEVSKPNPLLFAVSPITVEPERSRTPKAVPAVGGFSASQSVKTVEPKPTETMPNGYIRSEIPPAVKPIQQTITKSKSEPDLTRGTSPAGSQRPKTPTSELKTPVVTSDRNPRPKTPTYEASRLMNTSPGFKRPKTPTYGTSSLGVSPVAFQRPKTPTQVAQKSKSGYRGLTPAEYAAHGGIRTYSPAFGISGAKEEVQDAQEESAECKTTIQEPTVKTSEVSKPKETPKDVDTLRVAIAPPIPTIIVSQAPDTSGTTSTQETSTASCRVAEKQEKTLIRETPKATPPPAEGKSLERQKAGTQVQEVAKPEAKPSEAKHPPAKRGDQDPLRAVRKLLGKDKVQESGPETKAAALPVTTSAVESRGSEDKEKKVESTEKREGDESLPAEPLLKVTQKPKGLKSKVSGWSRLKKHMVVEQEVPRFPEIGPQKEAPVPDRSEVQRAAEKAADGAGARDENQTKDAPVAAKMWNAVLFQMFSTKENIMHQIEMNKSEGAKEAKEEGQKHESKEIPSFAHRLPVLLFSPKFDAKRLKEAASRPVTKISTVFEMGLIGRKGKEEEPKDFNRTARGFAAI